MINVKFTLLNDKVDDYSDEELIAWLRYELGNIGHLDGKNPLVDEDIHGFGIEIERT